MTSGYTERSQAALGLVICPSLRDSLHGHHRRRLHVDVQCLGAFMRSDAYLASTIGGSLATSVASARRIHGEVGDSSAQPRVTRHTVAMPAVSKIVGLMTARQLAGGGKALSAMLRTVAGRGDMGASGVDRFVDRRVR